MNNELKVKNGDVIEFITLQWDEQWDFDYPTVMLQPVIQYSSDGTSGDQMIEEVSINLCCGDTVEDENVVEEFKWRRWNIDRMKIIAKNRLKGKSDWKSRSAKVTYQKIRFFINENNEMEFDILESIEK